MKVLHVLYSKIYTGAEKVAAQIIKAFEGRVDMAYCSLECEEVWNILDGMGIRHYGVEELTPATLSRVIREYRPDVIHAHDMRTSFVAALCCGISDGCGMGDNTRALLITRALSEISRLAECMGGRKETLAGLAGMGDLIVTCTSMHIPQRMHSGWFGVFVTSTSILQALAHFPQETHLFLSTFI